MNESIIKISIDALNNSSSLTQNFPLVDTHIANASIPPIDPYWFYSSIAQSAAAIVGLMGALIVTKLINEKSFFENLQQDIEEYKHKVQSITEDIKTKKEWLDKVDLEKNTKLAREYLASWKQDIDLEDPPNVNFLYNIAKEEEDYHDLDQTIFEKEYTEYLKTVKEDKNEQSPPSLLGTEFISIMPIARLDAHSIDPGLKKKQYEEEIKKQQAEISTYEVLLKDKINHLKDNREILNLRKYIIALLIFSIIGVFVPLYVMLFDHDIMMGFRFGTLVIVFIGWLIILGFFYIEVHNLINLKITKK